MFVPRPDSKFTDPKPCPNPLEVMTPDKNDDLRSRLADFDAAIFAKQALLNKINQDMVKLRTDRGLIQSQLDSIVYPIQSLPLDVTLEIFGHCGLVREHHHGYWSPTTVFRVCKSWREIALATPSLWKTIDFRPRYGRSGYAVERYLDYRVTVAQDCPLSVSISGEDIVENLGKQGFFALICRLAPRLYSLKLEVAVSGLFELGRHPPSFPLLEKLEIYLDDENVMSNPIEKAFTIAPLLREHVSPEECCYILEEAQNLVEATFRLDTHTLPPGDLEDPVRHSHLQTFTLAGASSDRPRGYTTDLLSLLTFPALRSLQLLDATEGDIEQIRSFVTRHAAQLRTFSFSGWTTRAITINVVRPMLNLTDLTLDLGTAPVHFFQSLVSPLIPLGDIGPGDYQRAARFLAGREGAVANPTSRVGGGALAETYRWCESVTASTFNQPDGRRKACPLVLQRVSHGKRVLGFPKASLLFHLPLNSLYSPLPARSRNSLERWRTVAKSHRHRAILLNTASWRTQSTVRTTTRPDSRHDTRFRKGQSFPYSPATYRFLSDRRGALGPGRLTRRVEMLSSGVPPRAPLAGQRVFTFPGSAQSGDELWPLPRHCVTLFNASWRTFKALMRTVGFLGVGSQPSCTLVVGPQA
ncbi:hypothetical protein C8R46DRAFT_1270068 [Mycena filopes]|nr:hypothetical protein C8R46DRAFT_1270068 [Mycena filopes]